MSTTSCQGHRRRSARSMQPICRRSAGVATASRPRPRTEAMATRQGATARVGARWTVNRWNRHHTGNTRTSVAYQDTVESKCTSVKALSFAWSSSLARCEAVGVDSRRGFGSSSRLLPSLGSTESFAGFRRRDVMGVDRGVRRRLPRDRARSELASGGCTAREPCRAFRRTHGRLSLASSVRLGVVRSLGRSPGRSPDRSPDRSPGRA